MANIPSALSLQFIKGVGPAKAKLFANLGISTVEDLLYFFPYRYEDRSAFVPISKLEVGKIQSMVGTVLAVGKRNFYSKNKTFEIAVGDATGKIFCAWFNQQYLDKYFKVGQEIVFYGKVDIFRNRLQMVQPDFELILAEDRSLNMGRIVPIYSLTKGISQKYLRYIIEDCLKEYAAQLKDIIPPDVRAKQNLAPLSTSIAQIHFPTSTLEQEKASERIAFEEFFLFQVSVILRRLSVVAKEGKALEISDSLKTSYTKSLPFALTDAQQKAIQEIASDLGKSQPMLRLLQGDVGCGKTVVAFFAVVANIKNGFQVAMTLYNLFLSYH